MLGCRCFVGVRGVRDLWGIMGLQGLKLVI